MIIQLGDLNIEIDVTDKRPGAVLYRREFGQWKPYLVDGKTVAWPTAYEELQPGTYRLQAPEAE
jgi:hypothetical protein